MLECRQFCFSTTLQANKKLHQFFEGSNKTFVVGWHLESQEFFMPIYCVGSHGFPVHSDSLSLCASDSVEFLVDFVHHINLHSSLT